MLKKLTVCCLVGILAAVLVLSGCGGDKQAPESAAKPEAQPQTQAETQVDTPAQAQAQTPEQTPADTQGPSSSDKAGNSGDGEVTALLAKSKEIKEISFEYEIIEGKERAASGGAWVKGSRVKNEITVDGQTMASIYDTAKGEAYMYVKGEKTATLSELTPEITGFFQTPTNFYDDVDVSMVKIVDTETYDGHKCKVMSIVDETGWEESKMWVSVEYGIPLRIETDDAAGLLVLEYKNIKVGSVPDDVFQLPKGVEILDMRTPK